MSADDRGANSDWSWPNGRRPQGARAGERLSPPIGARPGLAELNPRSVRKELPPSRSCLRAVPPKRFRTEPVDSLLALSSHPGSPWAPHSPRPITSRMIDRVENFLGAHQPFRRSPLRTFVNRPQAWNPRLFDWRPKRVKALVASDPWQERRLGRKQMKAKSTIVGLTGEPLSRRGLIVSAGARRPRGGRPPLRRLCRGAGCDPQGRLHQPAHRQAWRIRRDRWLYSRTRA